MISFIPYGRQEITDDDIQHVVDVLKSDFLTQGPAIERFEQKFAEYCGVKYAVAVSSCTAGLHLACLSLGLAADDMFWTVPNTFVASANCGLYCGADVDFVDIDPRTLNMSVLALEEKLAQAEKDGVLPSVVIPVHFSGRSCDMKALAALAERYGFKIIEDAAHCVGASYDGQKVGACGYSDVSVFSLHPVKIVTSGEGGMITTNDPALYQKLLRLRTHGITRDPEIMSKKSEGAWYFEQQDLGYHYRMTDIQAALGISQMNRVDSYVQKRRDLVRRYNRLLAGLPLQCPSTERLEDSSWHLYVIRLDLDRLSMTRAEIFHALREAGIGVNVHYIPVHYHPYYQERGFKKGTTPQAEQYYQEALTLPLFPGLTEQQQDFIVMTLKEILR